MSEPTWLMQQHSNQLDRQVADLRAGWNDAAAQRIQSRHLVPRERDATTAANGLRQVQEHAQKVSAAAKSITEAQKAALEQFTAIEEDLERIAEEEDRGRAHADQSVTEQQTARERMEHVLRELSVAGASCGEAVALGNLSAYVANP